LGEPLEWIHILPPTPGELAVKSPKVFETVFRNEHPCLSKIAFGELSNFDMSYGCRGGTTRVFSDPGMQQQFSSPSCMQQHFSGGNKGMGRLEEFMSRLECMARSMSQVVQRHPQQPVALAALESMPVRRCPLPALPAPVEQQPPQQQQHQSDSQLQLAIGVGECDASENIGAMLDMLEQRKSAKNVAKAAEGAPAVTKNNAKYNGDEKDAAATKHTKKHTTKAKAKAKDIKNASKAVAKKPPIAALGCSKCRFSKKGCARCRGK